MCSRAIVNQHSNTEYFLHFGNIYTRANSAVGEVCMYYDVSNSRAVVNVEEAYIDRCLQYVLGRDIISAPTVLSNVDDVPVVMPLTQRHNSECDDALVLVGRCGDVEYTAKFDHLMCYLQGTQYKIAEFGAMYYSHLRGECWPWAHSDDFWYDGCDLYFREHRLLDSHTYGAVIRKLMSGRTMHNDHVMRSTIPTIHMHAMIMCLRETINHDLVSNIASWVFALIRSAWSNHKK